MDTPLKGYSNVHIILSFSTVKHHFMASYHIKHCFTISSQITRQLHQVLIIVYSEFALPSSFCRNFSRSYHRRCCRLVLQNVGHHPFLQHWATPDISRWERVSCAPRRNSGIRKRSTKWTGGTRQKSKGMNGGIEVWENLMLFLPDLFVFGKCIYTMKVAGQISLKPRAPLIATIATAARTVDWEPVFNPVIKVGTIITVVEILVSIWSFQLAHLLWICKTWSCFIDLRDR